MAKMASDSFKAGYIDGVSGNKINSRIAFIPSEYYDGYSVGVAERQTETGKFPNFLTLPQVESLCRVYYRDPEVAFTREEFINQAVNYGDYCGILWHGMFLGIEKDGYTHS